MLTRLAPLTSQLNISTATTASRRISYLTSLVPSSTARMSPNITLYTAGTPNGHKPSIVLEELGLDYKVKSINMSVDEQKEPWFLDINPNGRIPAIRDGELRVFESGAIMLYLTDKYDPQHKISFPAGSDDYYEMMSWLMFQMGGIGPMQGQANHFRAMAKVRSDYGIKRYIDETIRLISVLESRLISYPYLAGDKYSVADIANFAWVRLTQFLDVDMSVFPATSKWIATIGKRPGVQAGLKVPADSRTQEQWKEIFNSMKAKIDAMDNTDKS